MKIYMYEKDIPQCCNDCPCCVESEYGKMIGLSTFFCVVIEREADDILSTEMFEKRLDNCPISSIEEQEKVRSKTILKDVYKMQQACYKDEVILKRLEKKYGVNIETME